MAAKSQAPRGFSGAQKLLKAVALKKNNKRRALRVVVFF
jgi:hypothetical protein